MSEPDEQPRAEERPESPRIDPPTPEIGWGGVSDASARLPGARREYTKFPTAPVDMPQLPGLHPDYEWAPEPAPTPQHGFLSPWALVFSAVALVVSLFVGWGFPLALGGIVTGIIALRRPLENRPAAIWAIVLGGVSLLYSGGWLLWAATQANLLTIPIVR